MSYYIPERIRKLFKERENKAIELIKKSGIKYDEIGIFGSYSRGDYKANSDIDILVITEELPEPTIRGLLYGNLDMIGVQLVYSKRSVFNESTVFSKEVQRDYKRIL